MGPKCFQYTFGPKISLAKASLTNQLFIALNLCTAVMVWAYFPETKGLSLEEIADLFGDEVVPETRLDRSINSPNERETRDLNPSKEPSADHFEQVHQA
ncbi:hypothetical protein AG1IA_10294 [Rhizoctonia solani AG-1 IA]|uniref:Uncharacterized protein n=1 Tax=Thanatephorus cucumeris (strain AG1-IA) TaxID=983506 RepID=L8WBW7_THACA|nr:hypothetical protein AG1IA_10294 [Rhizoctonia solani AG-1 IA]